MKTTSFKFSIALAIPMWIGMLLIAQAADPLLVTPSKQALPHKHTEGVCGGVELIAVDAPPRGFEPASGDFNIVVTWDASVSAAFRVVIQHAVNEWNALLQSKGVNPGNYPITIRHAPLNGPVGLTTSTFNANDGTLISAVVTFATEFTFYVDPNPADDVEFGADPPPDLDLLSVARHELGHALGWTRTSRILDLVADNVFDASRINVPIIVSGGFHADPAFDENELMVPSIETSTRRPIKLYPTVAVLARAFEYSVPMHFVDPAYGGTETGTAWQPWRTFFGGAELAPPNVPLLLAPTTHATLRNHNHSIPRTIYSARGGATVLGLNLP